MSATVQTCGCLLQNHETCDEISEPNRARASVAEVIRFLRRIAKTDKKKTCQNSLIHGFTSSLCMVGFTSLLLRTAID